MTTASADTELRQANVDLITRYFELWNVLDIDTVETLLHPDVELELPYSPPGAPDVLSGKPSVAEFLHAAPERMGPLGFHQLEVATFEDPNELVAEYRSDAVVHGTNKPYRNRYITRITISDGQIRRFKEFSNPLVLMEAFGIDAGSAND
jgi:ketosteroid isomerase-like protein